VAGLGNQGGYPVSKPDTEEKLYTEAEAAQAVADGIRSELESLRSAVSDLRTVFGQNAGVQIDAEIARRIRVYS
jgi:hypothetical protein